VIAVVEGSNADLDPVGLVVKDVAGVDVVVGDPLVLQLEGRDGGDGLGNPFQGVTVLLLAVRGRLDVHGTGLTLKFNIDKNILKIYSNCYNFKIIIIHFNTKGNVVFVI